MKKITKEDYNEIRFQFSLRVVERRLPSLKQQTRSKKRRQFYKKFGKIYGVYEGTIRRVVKSKNYADYLQKGRDNRGNSTKRKKLVKKIVGGDGMGNYTEWNLNDNNEYIEVAKPKRYKTTIISTKPFLVGQQRFDQANESGEIESYTVEVLND